MSKHGNGNQGKNNLGKGLSALFEEFEDFDNYSDVEPKTLPIDIIVPNPYQPRKEFDPISMKDLENSIRKNGILQPIAIRKENNEYQIIAGERRWRAAKSAGLKTIPVFFKNCETNDLLSLALIENLQRENLNPAEEAESLKKLIDEHGKTQEEIAKLINKSRSYVTNALRLLNLPESVKQMVKDEKITAGHARTLIKSSNPEKMANKIIAENLTVRDAERFARENPEIADVSQIASDLSQTLQTKVYINIRGNGSGTMNISFKNIEQLDAFIQILQHE